MTHQQMQEALAKRGLEVERAVHSPLCVRGDLQYMTSPSGRHTETRRLMVRNAAGDVIVEFSQYFNCSYEFKGGEKDLDAALLKWAEKELQ